MRQHREKNLEEKSDLEQRIIDLSRVTRVTAGGKRMRFRACVVVGNKKGQVGWGVAKGADVTIAVNKAATKAKKRLIQIPLTKGTIPHQVQVKFKAATVLLKPASEGTGIIAGGAVRIVLELAGVPNIYSKILGSNNKINNVRVVFDALTSFKNAPVHIKSETAIDEEAEKLRLTTAAEVPLVGAEEKMLKLTKDEKELLKKLKQE